MKPKTTIRKMISMMSGRPLDQLTRPELEKVFKLISTLPIYFVDVYGELGLPQLKDSIYYAKRRYGIGLVVIDHLHFFLKYSADLERQAIDQGLKDIKAWAMDLGIHIVLVVHPTKLTYDNKIVHLNDLKGSSGLKQIPDNVLSIWRPRGEDDLKKPQSEVLLYVLKVRDDDGEEGKVILNFDKRSQSYSDLSHGGASPSEGKGFPRPSSTARPERNWVNGYDS
jgi:replicative DNA helicase